MSLVLLLSSQGKETILTNSQGQSIKVKLVGFEDGVVDILLLKNRKTSKLKMIDIDETSQEIVNKWVKEGGHLSTRFEIDYSSGKSDRAKYRAYYNERRSVKLEPRVTIKNGFGSKHTRPVKMTVLVLARPVRDKSDLYVLAKERFDIPSLAPHKSTTVALKEVETEYDESNYYKQGYKYVGYAVFLESNDEVVATKYTPATVESKYGVSLLKARVESVAEPVK